MKSWYKIYGILQLPLSSICEFPVEWDSHGIKENGVRDHVVYLERLCKFLLEQGKKRLGEYIQDSDDRLWKSNLYKEVSHHVRHCHER